jgi:phosphate transport system permease protein
MEKVIVTPMIISLPASNLEIRKRKEKIFKLICILSIVSSLMVLGILFYHIAQEGIEYLGMDFLTRFQSRFAAKSGIKAGLWGTIWLMTPTILISVPIGVLTAIFLQEYPIKGRIGRFIELNIANLAGVPSIVYGLLGLSVFVHWMGLGRSVLSGALTMSLLILPVIIVSAKEALAAVPDTIRQGAYALGARKFQVVFGQVLPAAIPGILTGVILAVSRGIGEAAPLIVVGALSYVAYVPSTVMDEFTVLPIQIYNWAGRPQQEFHKLAASGILVLLVLMLTMNLTAILIRNRRQKRMRL